MANISYYGSHNATLVIENDGIIICVLEFERFTNIKNCGLAHYQPAPNPFTVLKEALLWIEKEYSIKEFDNCYFASHDIVLEDFERRHFIFQTTELIPAKNYEHVSHHLSHAYNVFYQSPYKEALVISFDGGGDDGEFNIYHAKRKQSMERIAQFINPIKNNQHIYYNLGFAYMVFGLYLKDIKIESLNDGNLIWPGKIMGLVSYGNVNDEWLPHFIEFYKNDPDGGNEDYQKKIDILGARIGIVFDRNDRIDGKIAYDIAATSQKAFEECFLEKVLPFMEQYSNLPICLAGGCALNIILNTRLVTEFKKTIFVGPNPNDCGIALGMMLKHLQPEEQFDATYAGIPILDKALLSQYIVSHRNPRKLMKKNDNWHAYEQWDPEILVDDLINGKIIGIVRGNAEHGPRALGNRSILCNPTILDMKDILNSKVKNREWYRPFAPVVRLEDVNKYFEWEGESRHMSFCPKVREEWRNKLPAITHVDGTARVQTVTKEQNEWLYNLLTEFDKKTGIGVLLNTSFNVNGKPILSTYKDAFHIFDTTQLDGLLIEDFYTRKEKYVDF